MLAVAGLGATGAAVRAGAMALAGEGTARNVAQGIALMSRDKYRPHHYQLGLLYAGGQGVPRDMKKAVLAMRRTFGDREGPLAEAWLKRQADAGNADAQIAYAEELRSTQIEREQSGRTLTDAQLEAAEAARARTVWLYTERAAQQGQPEAMRKMAGKSGLSDAEKLRWLRRAVDAGSGWAMLEMSSGYGLGWYGLPKDRAAAERLQDRAARLTPTQKAAAERLAIACEMDRRACGL